MCLIRFSVIICIIWNLNQCLNTEESGHGDFIGNVHTELSQLQAQFVASERFYKDKLAAMEKRLHETENLQLFYQHKVSGIENLLQKSMETGISYKKKLEQVEGILYQTERRLTNAELTIQTLISANKKSHFSFKTDPESFNNNRGGPDQSTLHHLYQNSTHTYQYNNSQDYTDVRFQRNTGTTNNLQIAFSSYISQHLEHLQTQQTIPFDEIIVNEGNAYDASTFKFTCPISGVYVFQSAVMAQRYKYIQTEIVKDGVPLVRMYAATDTTTSRFDQGFNSIITYCYHGEKVWVRVVDSWGTDIRSSRFTTFSGYLLWQL